MSDIETDDQDPADETLRGLVRQLFGNRESADATATEDPQHTAGDAAAADLEERRFIRALMDSGRG